MRSPLILLVVLAVVAAGYLLLAGDDEPVYAPEPLEPPDVPPAATAEAVGTPRTSNPRRAPPRSTPARRRPPAAVDPSRIGRGRIDVRPVGLEGQSIDTSTLRVSVEPTATRDWTKQLGQIDPETGVWSFRKVLAGEVLVHVYGDYVIDAKQKAVVDADAQTELTVRLRPAGAIRYDVRLSDRTRPREVLLVLQDEAEKPVLAWYQVRTARTSGKARQALRIKQGPEGVVFGVPPGRYRLRAAVEGGEGYDVPVNVTPGETQTASFELRR